MMTNAELAILALVAEESRYGYEIEQIIEERGMRDWTEIGFSSIYYILKKLEKESFIVSRLVHSKGQGPARKVFSITSEGQKAHTDGALDALSSPRHASTPFLLGLSCYPNIPSEQVGLAVKKYIAALDSRLDQINLRIQQQSPLPPYVEEMFDYSRSMISAERDWMEGFLRKVESGNV
jgi:DNA-binding PadR family transcriptional regulator